MSSSQNIGSSNPQNNATLTKNPWQLSKLLESSIAETARSIQPWDGETSGFKNWKDGVEQIANMLKVKEFLTLKKRLPVPESERFNPTVESKEDNFDLDEDDDLSTIRLSVHEAPQVAPEIIPDDHYYSLSENLQVIFATIWRTIHACPNLMTKANKNNAMDDNDPIKAFQNIYSEYVEVTGITVTALLAELVNVRQERGENCDSLITRFDRIRRELIARDYEPDDVLMCSMLVLSLSDDKTRDKLNDLITALNAKRKRLPWANAAELVRSYSKQKSTIQTARKAAFHQKDDNGGNKRPHTPFRPRGNVKPTDDGSQALLTSTDTKKDSSTSSPSDSTSPCWNCGSSTHTGNDCTASSCRIHPRGTHPYKDCLSRPTNSGKAKGPPRKPQQPKSANMVEHDEFDDILRSIEHSVSMVEVTPAPAAPAMGVGDSGATTHASPPGDFITKFQPLSNGPLTHSALGTSTRATGVGRVGDLPGTVVVSPDFTKTLFSIATLDKIGGTTLIHQGVMLPFRATDVKAHAFLLIAAEIA